MSMLKIVSQKVTDENEKSGLSFFLNPYSYLELRKQQKLLSSADNIYIDGQWLCHFLKWFGVTNVKRCSFDNSSLAPNVFSLIEKSRAKVAVIGSDRESSEEFKKYLLNQYPDLNLVISQDGYFKDAQEIKQTHLDIIDKQVDLVIVGMGVIRQESFLKELKELGWNGSGYTCGGFMHQTASKGHDYYPAWVDKLNLRFAYRIWDEPKLFRRYTLDYGLFVAVFILDLLRLRVNKHV